MMKFQPNQLLKTALADQSLFVNWLDGRLQLGPATYAAAGELGACLDSVQGGATGTPSPFFAATRNAESGPTWAATLMSDLPDAQERRTFQANLDLLQEGRAQVVVTGQQPGSMGGPLYTLFKIATAVALAQRRTRRGLPTVPVFWSGDDDDDLVEALKTRSWDPLTGQLFSYPGSLGSYADGTRQKPCVGNLRASAWSYQASQWLNNDRLQPLLPVLGQDLALLWAEACAEEWTWSKLNRRFLSRVFRGAGLIVVSGNDPFLHRTARPLYDKILPRRRELADMARSRGIHLKDNGYPVPISDRSLHRNLFVAEGPGRRFLGDEEAVADTSILRPGVMLRSPVQDWLFEPAAVVVGPGELAYLRQLDPVYSQLNVTRCPLVPRLFGWIVPPGFPPSLLEAGTGKIAGGMPDVGHLAGVAAEVAEREVRRLLVAELGTDPDRAASLAAGRSRRWRKSLEAMFRDEARRRQSENIPGDPVWVFPEGARQERVLSSLTLAALWGDDMMAGLIDGAAEHIEKGQSGQWREFVVQAHPLKGVTG